MAIGIIANLEKGQAVAITRQILNELDGLRELAKLDLPLAAAINRADLGVPESELASSCDAIVVLGGDGTLLSVARRSPFWGVPLMGVNIGHLGYLTEVEERGLPDALKMMVRGEFWLQDRMMLKAAVWRGSNLVAEAFALNECVVTKGAFARMIRLEIHIGKSYLETFPADGVIVSTPTGSTAYSLSAGGPIVDPAMQLLLLTPICAHMLQARPVVISPHEQIRIRMHAVHEDIVLTVDGQEGIRLLPNDEIVIERASVVTRLIKLAPRSFYDVLRHKLTEVKSTKHA